MEKLLYMIVQVIGGKMPNVQTVSRLSNGKVILPFQIRKALGLLEGNKFLVVVDGQNLLLKPMKSPKLLAFKELIKESRKIVKDKKLKRSIVPKLIKDVRHEDRS